MSRYVFPMDALAFAGCLEPGSVRLVLTDPPYSGIIGAGWDNKWNDNPDAFGQWLFLTLGAFREALTPDGSIIFFGGTGKPGNRALLSTILRMDGAWTFRQWITWKKRRAYGKSHDYLYTREEILWYSKSPDRTSVVFNIPLLNEKRGYAGWDPNHPAKSEFKRVSNVWTDIPMETVVEDIGEIMRPERDCQKPVPLLERLVSTHSNPGDLVVDPFTGWGTTGVAARNLGRNFLGCDTDAGEVPRANERISKAGR